jgi:hypothetical protein
VILNYIKINNQRSQIALTFSLICIMLFVSLIVFAFPSVVISPQKPNVTDDLSCVISSPVNNSYDVFWYKNKNLFFGYSFNDSFVVVNITANETCVDDSWMCVAKFNDSLSLNDSVVIGNDSFKGELNNSLDMNGTDGLNGGEEVSDNENIVDGDGESSNLNETENEGVNESFESEEEKDKLVSLGNIGIFAVKSADFNWGICEDLDTSNKVCNVTDEVYLKTLVSTQLSEYTINLLTGSSLSIDTSFLDYDSHLILNAKQLVLKSGSSINANINISVENLTIEETAYIQANYLGYNNSGIGKGLDGDENIGASGGGHGGQGGDGNTGVTGGIKNDEIVFPVMYGSAGGNAGGLLGGVGGGYIYLNVTDSFNFHGSLLAKGQSGLVDTNLATGGGAGGSIIIRTNSFNSTGFLDVRGGDGRSSDGAVSGGGSGGRISIDATERLASYTYNISGGAYYGEAGSLYEVIGGDLTHGGDTLNLMDDENYNLLVLNGGIVNIKSSVIVNKAILNGGRINVDDGYVFNVTDMIINGSVVINGNVSSDNFTVTSLGNLTHDANNDTHEYYIDINTINFTIKNGGSINIDSKGYATGYGPGKGHDGKTHSPAEGASFAGYGGKGHHDNDGKVYGDFFNLIYLGSGGGLGNSEGSVKGGTRC